LGSYLRDIEHMFFLHRNIQVVLARELDPAALVVFVLAEETEQPAMLLLKGHRAKSFAELIVSGSPGWAADGAARPTMCWRSFASVCGHGSRK